MKAPKVDVQGVRHAGHMLMIENWEETNSAIILAAGGKLDWKAPLPGQFSDGRDVGFFKGSRFRKSDAVDEPNTTPADDSVVKPSPVVDPVGT